MKLSHSSSLRPEGGDGLIEIFALQVLRPNNGGFRAVRSHCDHCDFDGNARSSRPTRQRWWTKPKLHGLLCASNGICVAGSGAWLGISEMLRDGLIGKRLL